MMDVVTDDKERKARAEKRRRTMTVRFTTLDDETDPWPIRGAEAISLVTQITRDVWSLSGQPSPQYERKNMPVRCIPHLEE